MTEWTKAYRYHRDDITYALHAAAPLPLPLSAHARLLRSQQIVLTRIPSARRVSYSELEADDALQRYVDGQEVRVHTS